MGARVGQSTIRGHSLSWVAAAWDRIGGPNVRAASACTPGLDPAAPTP